MKAFIAVCVAAAVLISTGGVVVGQTAPPAGQGRATAPPGQRGGGRAAAPASRGSAATGTNILWEITNKGTFEMETYPAEAPKTVAHILALVRRNFYNGQRIHRVVPGFVVQWGDPLSRDVTKKNQWGTGGSGTPIGVAEINTHKHQAGAVAMAHAGDPKGADSQLYVAFGPQPRLDSGYTVFGQVISGMDVVQKLEVGDVIRRASVKAATPAAKPAAPAAK
jgi:peptidyl-prolyl cis-trans isomerase B (cyclophilin B)